MIDSEVTETFLKRFSLRNGGQWLAGKAMDKFCPIGPALVTSDEVGDIILLLLLLYLLLLSCFTSPSPFNSPPPSFFSSPSHSPSHSPYHSPSLPSHSLYSLSSPFHSHSPSFSPFSSHSHSPSLSLLLLLLLLCPKVGDTNNLNLSCTVNGVVKQDSNTKQLVFGVAEVCFLNFQNILEICKHVPGCILGVPVHHPLAWGHHPHRFNSIGHSEVGQRDLV